MDYNEILRDKVRNHLRNEMMYGTLPNHLYDNMPYSAALALQPQYGYGFRGGRNILAEQMGDLPSYDILQNVYGGTTKKSCLKNPGYKWNPNLPKGKQCEKIELKDIEEIFEANPDLEEQILEDVALNKPPDIIVEKVLTAWQQCLKKNANKNLTKKQMRSAYNKRTKKCKNLPARKKKIVRKKRVPKKRVPKSDKTLEKVLNTYQKCLKQNGNKNLTLSELRKAYNKVTKECKNL